MMKHKAFLSATLLSLGLLATGCVAGEESVGELRRGSANCPSDFPWTGALGNFNTCGSVAVLSSLPVGGGESTMSLPNLFSNSGTVEFRLSLPAGSEQDTMIAYLTGNGADGPHGLTLKYEPGEDGLTQAVLSVWQGKHIVDLAWPARDGDALRWQIANGHPSIWLNGRLLGKLDPSIQLAPRTPYTFLVGVQDTDASGSALGMGLVALDVYAAPTPGGSDF